MPPPGQSPLAWAAGGGVVFIILSAYFLDEYRIARKLQTNGITVQAEVVRKWRIRGFSGNRYSCGVMYQFHTKVGRRAGSTYSRRQTVSEFHYNQIGGRVTVAYRADNPRVSRLAGPDRDTTSLDSLWIWVAGSLAVTVIAFLVAVMY